MNRATLIGRLVDRKVKSSGKARRLCVCLARLCQAVGERPAPTTPKN
jgi:hypothetical protein